jgi:hypothetical protein
MGGLKQIIEMIEQDYTQLSSFNAIAQGAAGSI